MASTAYVQTLAKVRVAVNSAKSAASKATSDYISKHGNYDMCGFAWIKTNVRGNTLMGKALKECGFRASYEGGLDMWNPSGNATKSISAKEAGADAAAKVLTEQLGIPVYSQSRLD